ncbi:unnamed protein product [Rotaria sp. Silwood2]|nr:unnamed protein product [Rotaria sp. Silwood2]CAF3455675.1 unnamed protein product [Rotaria sp. Silwood2]CAF4085186.1 unnamed protein product [Rotaria sp. Silwood2]CAF4762788.1 unnamed protein product [Rotaria sp. Silwood2]
MSDQQSSQNISTSSKIAVTTTRASSDAIHPKKRIIQNFLLIWMDVDIDQSKDNCQNTLIQLRSVVNDVTIFSQPDECVDFLTEVDGVKAFLIVASTIGQQIVPLIHDVPQLDAVYIFNDNKHQNEKWTKEWAKIKGVHTEITPICEALQLVSKQCGQDCIPLSFFTIEEVASNQNLNQLEPSFMYTQIFKEILLDLKYDEQSVKKFTAYCRNGDYGAPATINRFENEYYSQLAIW